MLHNSAIIKNMTEEQKLAVVTDFGGLASDAVNAIGVPRVETSDLDALNAKFGGSAKYAPLSFLAHSWNTKLAENVAGDIVRRNGTEKVNVIGTPNMGVRLNAYVDGFSEDPYLSARFAGAFSAAIDNYGGTACINEFGLRGADADYLDRSPSETVISNVISRPFDAVMRSRAPMTVGMTYGKLKGEWKDVNAKLVSSALGKNYTRAVLGLNANDDALHAGLAANKLLFVGASSSAVRAALKNYRRMKEDVERGSVTVGELQKALSVGTAISDEMLDEAVDKVIDFAASVIRPREHYAVNASDSAPSPDEYGRQFALLAAEESTVLLKNAGGILPVVHAAKVAAIGELARSFPDLDEAAEKICGVRGATYVGQADGYALDAERSDDLLASAKALANEADVLLAFVGLGERREKRLAETKSVKLPANQSAMLDMLVKTGKTVIAVVTGSVLPDMKFDNFINGVLYAPSGCSRSAESLFNILFGIICPSGKLAVTAYDDTDERFAAMRHAVANGRYKMGEFIGYRRYASENERIRYPFGHGLSYTEFKYSNLKINSDSVEITVRNIGARAGFEVAQLYVGKTDSAIIRPARELKGFAKVMIAPNAAVQISFPLNAAMLEVFDENDGRRKTEGGKYQIYVGASSADIRLTGEMNIAGEKIKSRGEKLSDYLPSLSNIVSGGYKMNSVGADKNAAAFKSARPDDGGFGYEQLFAEEFGDDEVEEANDTNANGDDDILSFLDDGITVKSIAEGLTAYALSKGYKLNPDTAMQIVAAFAASRVVIMRCDSQAFAAVTELLCGYFGCPFGIDDAKSYMSSDDLFGTSGADTRLSEAVAFSASHRDVVTVCALDNVAQDTLGEVFAPFIRYATAPDNITVAFAASKRSVSVAPNMWFVMRTNADGAAGYPVYLADMATVIIPELSAAGVAADRNGSAPNYYQLVSACQRAERDGEVEEQYWKKVDRLESYVAARTPFVIDNKMWVQMERFISVCLACGSEQPAALDRAVAAKLVPLVASELNGKLAADDETLPQTLDAVFGEDDAAHCKNAVKRIKA